MTTRLARRILIGLAIGLQLLLLTASLSLAQEEARVSLETLELTDSTLVVGVAAENVTNLYGAEFKLRYDPAVLAVKDADVDRDGIQVEPGDFLPANQGFVVVNQAESELGSVTYALTLLNPAPPVNGTGLLARVTFNVQQSTPTLIEFEKAKLVSVDLQTIPNQMFGLNLDGSTTTPVEMEPMPDRNDVALPDVKTQPADEIDAEAVEVAKPAGEPAQAVPEGIVAAADEPPAAAEGSAQLSATAASEFPWWIVALGVMFLGFVGFGVLAVLGLNRSKPAAQATPSRVPTSGDGVTPNGEAPSRQKHVPGTRPSAFK